MATNAGNAGAIYVRIGLDVSEFDKKIKGVISTVEKASTQISAASKKFSGSFSSNLFNAAIGVEKLGNRLTELPKKFEGSIQQARRAGEAFRNIGTTLSVGLTLPIVAFGASTLKTAGDFEAAMNRVRAASGESTKVIQQLQDQAREMGKTTAFSALEAADAIEILVKNGLNATQIMEGALDASLSLAAATGANLATAADIATDAIFAFGQQASDLPRIVNEITGVVLASKFSIDDYRLALGQAGGAVGAVGVSLSDFNAVIAGTASAFGSGSDAGTSFKTFVNALVPKSKEAAGFVERLGLSFFDANGNMRSMAEIAEELRTKLSGLSEFERIDALVTLFGRDAIRTANALATLGADGINKFAKSFEGVDAAKQAEIRLQGFNGGLKKLRNALVELQITIGDSGLLGFATKLVGKFTKLVAAIGKFDPAILKVGTAIAVAVAAIGPLIAAVGTAISLFPFFVEGLAAIGVALKSVSAVMAGFAVGGLGPIAAVVAAIGGLAALIVKYVDVIDVSYALLQGNTDKAYASLKNSAKLFINDMTGLFLQFTDIFLAVNQKIQSAVGLDNAARGIQQIRDDFKSFAKSLKLDAIESTSQLDKMKETLDGLIDEFKKATDAQDDGNKKTTEQIGLLTGLRVKLDDLKTAKENAFSVNDIINFNAQIRETEKEIERLENAFKFDFSPISAVASISPTLDNKSLTDSLKNLPGGVAQVDTFFPILEAQAYNDQLGEMFARQDLISSQISDLISDGFSPYSAQVQGLVGAYDELGKQVDKVTGKQNEFALGMLHSVAVAAQGAEGIKDALKRVARQLIITGIIALVAKTFLNPLGNLFGLGQGAQFADVFKQLSQFQGIIGGAIPKFATGGIVTRPTLGIVGEGMEPEAILPLSKLNSMMEVNHGALNHAGIEITHRFEPVVVNGSDLLFTVRESEKREGRRF